LILLAAGTAVASSYGGIRHGLPTLAFDWAAGLFVLRAGVVFAILAALSIFLARAWGGYWPNQISTTGMGFPDDVQEGADDINAGSTEAMQALREFIAEEFARMRREGQ